MNTFNETPAVDYVKYFTEQLPRDLAQMAALRDELAVRQGAISAAQDAVADRKKAQQELDAARATAAEIQTYAKADAEVAKTELARVQGLEKAFVAKEAETTAALNARETQVAQREKSVASQAALVESQAAKLEQRAATLAAEEAALQARIKAFQDKVAAISI